MSIERRISDIADSHPGITPEASALLEAAGIAQELHDLRAENAKLKERLSQFNVESIKAWLKSKMEASGDDSRARYEERLGFLFDFLTDMLPSGVASTVEPKTYQPIESGRIPGSEVVPRSGLEPETN